jgi:tetratricopeptide (TPR) repeat protein
LAAYRSDELPRAHPIRRMRSELRRSGRLQQVVVEPLDAAATAALVDQSLGPATPALCRVVFDRTDGIPLYVAELAAALAASGRLQQGPSGLELLDGAEVPLPDSVRDAVLVRATGISANGFCAVHAYRDGARAFRCALELSPDGEDERSRLDVLQRLGSCAELAGDLGDAATVWREVADGRQRDGDLLGLGDAQRRLAAVLELQGRWQEALATRERLRHLRQPMHSLTRPPNASQRRRICARLEASVLRSTCWRPRLSRHAPRSGWTCKLGFSGRRGTPVLAWVRGNRV